MPYDGPGRYRHYKGGEYEVLGLALREGSVMKHVGGLDLIPEDQQDIIDVVYRPLDWGESILGQFHGESVPPGRMFPMSFWTRELGDFNMMVPPSLSPPFRNPNDEAPEPPEMIPRFQKTRPITALYFGTYRDVGHRWLAGAKNGRVQSDTRAVREWIEKNCPWGATIDGKLYDKQKETQNECIIHYKDGWTAIAFANRVDDSRGGCNGNFLFDTTLTFEQCIDEARRQLRPVLEHIEEHAGPLFLREDQRGRV